MAAASGAAAPPPPATERGDARWWDVVCLLAHDELQRQFYEAMVAARRSARLLPCAPDCAYLAVTLPGGISAGPDLPARLREPLQQVDNALRQRGEGGVSLADKRVLLVDGASHATLIPNLNVKGTLFAPLPAGTGVPGLPVGMVFDHKMLALAPLAQACPPGVFVTAGDLRGPYDPGALAGDGLEKHMSTVPWGDQELRAVLLDAHLPAADLGIRTLSDYARRTQRCAEAQGEEGQEGQEGQTRGQKRPFPRASGASVDEACRVSASASLLASTLSNTHVDDDAICEFSRVLGGAAQSHRVGKGAILSSVFWMPPTASSTGPPPPLVVPPEVLLVSCATARGFTTLFFGVHDDLEAQSTMCGISLQQLPAKSEVAQRLQQSGARGLLHTRLFPLCSDPTLSVAQALHQVHLILGNEPLAQEYADLCAHMSRSGAKEEGGEEWEWVSATDAMLMQEPLSLIARFRVQV